MKAETGLLRLLAILEGKGTLTREDVASIKASPTKAFRIVYSSEFDQFWGSYPFRGGTPVHKSETYAIWKRFGLDKDGAARILCTKALQVYKRSQRWVDGYVPDADRWLKGRPWEDISTEPRPDISFGGVNEW
jgi:hypothetical protein